MTFALAAAGLLLAPNAQPKTPDLAYGFKCDRVCQWMLVPGGAFVPVPMPFVVLVPFRMAGVSLPKVPLTRNEFHIVIEADQREIDMSAFTKQLVEKVQFELAGLQEGLPSVDQTLCPKAKADPHTVIDPVITGF